MQEEQKNNEKKEHYAASQWKLMSLRFKKHKLALVGTGIIIIFYLLAIFSEFIAPYDPVSYEADLSYMPPHNIRFFDNNGEFNFRPFFYSWEKEFDRNTFQTVWKLDKTKKNYIYFIIRGDSYEFLNIFKSNIHLFGSQEKLFLFGGDKLGRDVFSRIIYGTRISMSIGLIGVFLSFILGILIGGFSGYYGGLLDTVIQRFIELLRSIPTIPLWMALSASLPQDWSAIQNYFAITVILSLLGWTGLARQVRGKFISLREEDFITAALVSGTSEYTIIVRHMLPSFLSHVITTMTLAIPAMILGETSLSFLGIGLRPPVVSWGVLLQAAQNLRSVAMAPWLLLPGAFVFIAVISFNFMGDGLRDAADPYS